MSEIIRLAHGFGGKLSHDLINGLILPALTGKASHMPTLDAALVDGIQSPFVVSTDSFTISPRFFPGGDIGKLCVAGTVNDLVMMGAEPRCLSLSLIIEEGFGLDEFRTIMYSIGEMCRETGTTIVTGDTKVVEKGSCDGLFITTTGFGSQAFGPLGPEYIMAGDSIIITGTIGDHGAAVLNARENLGFSRMLESDCAPLHSIISAVWKNIGTSLHALRDPTRGGIAATLNELALDSGFEFIINEESIPIRPEVRSFTEILGLDPLILANEGKALLFVSPEAEQLTLDLLRDNTLGKDAAIIGRVMNQKLHGRVILETVIGTRRILEMPVEAGLPRIC